MVDIYIVGLGVLNVDHLTRETERVIRGSKEVLYVDTGVATRTYLESLCPRVTSLFETSYEEAGRRLNAYHHMAARVLDAALDHPPVTFAMHGHPIVGVYAPFLIRDLASLLSLEVRVLPGISAMDCLFAELMVDPCVTGMQMYEATDLLLRRRPLRSDVPALIWQIGTVETTLHSMRVSRPARFERLRTHLLRFYPPGHEVTAAFSTPHPLMPSTLHRFAIRDICDRAHLLHSGFTLFIPSATERAIEDHDLLRRMDTVEHLHQITREPQER
ncbi:MAG TPA: SAM-dependent methyltransferase [Phycisphaerae bacterium]|nr:SAM-dependent methyltransferase [Phycisphaerae bacterium]